MFPLDAQVVDVTGRFVTPGLVDAHVHFSQTGWVDGRPDGLPAPAIYPYAETARALRANPARWYRSYLCSGITAVYDVGGHPWTTALPARAANDPMAPHVRAAGPLITHAGRSALNVDDTIYTFLPMATSAEVQSSVAKLKAMGSSAVKVWYLAPQPESREQLDARMMEVGAAAKAARLDLIVHATGLREAKVALRAGAVLLVHSVEDQPVDQEFLDLLKRNRAIYAPTLVVGRNATRANVAIGFGERLSIDDPSGCVDSNTVGQNQQRGAAAGAHSGGTASADVAFRRLEAVGVRSTVMAENLKRVHAAGGTIATATDAGNPMTLHGPSIYWEMEAMQAAGIPQPDIIVHVHAKRRHRHGTREGLRARSRPGKVADLLILRSDPRAGISAFRSLTHVMRAGRLHTQASLRSRP